MPAALKRAAGVAGTLLCLLAAGFLLRRGLALGGAVGDAWARIPRGALAVALIVCLGANLLLGVAWSRLVRLVAARPPQARPLFAAHLRAQLAKYLPGNVFHFAYRHVAALRQGVSHGALGSALALESVLLLTAAAILALGVATDPRLVALAPHARGLVWAAPGVAVLAWFGSVALGRRSGLARLAPRRTAAYFAVVLLAYLAFFALSALVLRLLCVTPGALPFGAWCGWLALAWAVGYVTPGAPAGLGLREAVLALGLAPALGDADALAVALAYRLLTVVTDGVLALIGFALPDRAAALADGGSGAQR